MSLEECFEKFTDKLGSKVEMEALKHQNKTKEASGWTEGGKMRNPVNKVSASVSNYKETKNLMSIRVDHSLIDKHLLVKSFTATNIKKEVASVPIDTNTDGKEMTSVNEQTSIGIKKEYLNHENISEEYFEDIPSENEMDIKCENEINDMHIVEDDESSPTSNRMKGFLKQMKMGEPLLIAKHMIGQVTTDNHSNSKQKHSTVQNNDKRERTQCSEKVREVDIGEIMIKTLPSDDTFEGLHNIKLEDSMAEESVPRIKEEPNNDIENDPNDPLSVMFVVWKDDNCIDMIEDDLAHKDDLTRCTAPPLNRQSATYNPQIPRLKLNVSSSSNGLASQPLSNIPHKTTLHHNYR